MFPSISGKSQSSVGESLEGFLLLRKEDVLGCLD